jgi:hypothetical protein
MPPKTLVSYPNDEGGTTACAITEDDAMTMAAMGAKATQKRLRT